MGSRVWSGIKAVWENVKDEIEVIYRNEKYKARWKLDKSGTFSVKSAYNSIAKHGEEGRSWQTIWKINIPQRCKFHMWVSLHDRLLTNESLCDCHLHPNGVCGVCKTNIENLGH